MGQLESRALRATMSIDDTDDTRRSRRATERITSRAAVTVLNTMDIRRLDKAALLTAFATVTGIEITSEYFGQLTDPSDKEKPNEMS